MVAVVLVRQVVVSSQYDVSIFVVVCGFYLCLGDSYDQSISDQKQEIKSMIINILQNRSHMYYSHNSSIKYETSTMKCIDFGLIHYVINLNVVSFFMIFRNFDYMFLSMYC